MVERTDELTRDLDESAPAGQGASTSDFDANVDAFDSSFELGDEMGQNGTVTSREPTQTSDSRIGRATQRVSSLFSPSSFAIHLVGALTGVFVIGGLIPLIPFTGFVGLFLVAGLLGALFSKPHYFEMAVAGGASGALALFLNSITLTIFTGGLVPAAGGAIGVLAALIGYYAGRDLRDGMTKDL